MQRPRMILAALILSMASTSAAPARSDDLLIIGGRLFDSVGETTRPNSAIVIRGGKIAALDANPSELATEGLRVIELDADDTVLPGFFDLHAHYNIRVAGLPRTDETEHYSIIYLANGVTSTFPAGEYNPNEMLAMRRRIDRGEQIGPRIYNSGPYYGLSMRRGATAREVIERVDTWAEHGAAGFKAKSISPEQLRALIERAHQHGLTVTGHLGSGFRNSVNPKEAILMGIDRVEHFLGGDLLPPDRSAYASLEQLSDEDLDSPAFHEIVNLFIDRRVFFDATLSAYGYFGADDPVYERWHDESKYFTAYVQAWAEEREPPSIEQFVRIYEVKHKSLKRFYDAGGLITLGTDHVSEGVYLGGFAAHRELHAFVRAGIRPADALKMATTNGARALGVSDRLGTIEPGKFADLIVIKGDPLEDIRHTRRVHTIIKSGVVYDSAALLRSVEGRLGPIGPAR